MGAGQRKISRFGGGAWFRVVPPSNAQDSFSKNALSRIFAMYGKIPVYFGVASFFAGVPARKNYWESK
jgi:hypothetical protein